MNERIVLAITVKVEMPSHRTGEIFGEYMPYALNDFERAIGKALTDRGIKWHRVGVVAALEHYPDPVLDEG